MKGSGEGSTGCVVHVDVHGECVMLLRISSVRFKMGSQEFEDPTSAYLKQL